MNLKELLFQSWTNFGWQNETWAEFSTLEDAEQALLSNTA
jgi:hypothetical protein